MTDNELIEQWLGYECKCEIAQGEDFESGRYWGACPMHNEYYGNARPFVTVDSFAPILLNELVKKNYTPRVSYEYKKWQCLVTTPHMIAPMFFGDESTIAAAVSSAVLELIKKESKQCLTNTA